MSHADPLDRRATVMIVCAAVTFALTFGIRSAQSLFIGPINTASGVGLAAISLAFAVGQLMWGVTQPVAGMLSTRIGNGPVLVVGALAIAAGSALTPFASTPWALVLTIGVLGMGGAGFAGPSILMAALNQLLPPHRRAMATSLVNAGGSFGQFAVVPAAQVLLTATGWASALFALGAAALAIIPLSRVLWQPGSHGQSAAAADVSVRDALGDRSFSLLSAGFFVCGFHVAFIATHLPGVVAACGLPPSVGAWSLAVIGLFNIVGSFAIGWAMARWRSKSLLSLLYATRALTVAVFLAAPKTEATLLLFSAAIGVTYLSTVPATGNVVAKLYGLRNMATLFGLVFLSHQVGGFLGAWLGGKAFVATGSYDWMWYADIVLALFAALVHFPIREQPVVRPRAAAA
jgi:predicted MFS family arabinose efflux permease